MGARKTKVFVLNEKGKEFVGEISWSEDVGELTFGAYSRESEVMEGRATDAESVRVVAVTQGESVSGFHEYLRKRGKAAIAEVDGGRVVMLPSADLKLAVYSKSSSSKLALSESSTTTRFSQATTFPESKRRRLDEPLRAEDARREALLRAENARRDALVAALPLWSTLRSTPDDAMVFRGDDDDDDKKEKEGYYFQDARRRYEFRCGREGLRKLVALKEVSQRTSELLDDELASLDPAAREAILREGKKIYAEKPSLRKFQGGKGNVTWSDDEYAHAGLRAQYLRLKSIQRFTETYNLLHRAWSVDATVRSVFERPSLRVASLGGGPAFELVAFREFAATVASSSSSPRKQQPAFSFYSLDLQPAWKPYAETAGCAFAAPVDVNKITPDDVVKACGGQTLDVLVVSYLLIYCTNDHTADLFAALLERRLASLIFISERTHEQDIVDMLLRRGLAVTALMPQHVELDQRQLLVTRKADHRPIPQQQGPLDLLFPNVPFARGT